jgi:hypothetical protein
MRILHVVVLGGQNLAAYKQDGKYNGSDSHMFKLVYANIIKNKVEINENLLSL